MGSVAGKTASQESGLTPEFDVLAKSTGYEIRAYKPYVVAEVEAGAEPGKVNEDERFRTLAKVLRDDGPGLRCFLFPRFQIPSHV